MENGTTEKEGDKNVDVRVVKESSVSSFLSRKEGK